MGIMFFGLSYEWNVNVSVPHPAIEISLTYKNPSNKGLLSQHSECSHKTEYLFLNFKSNYGLYGHDLLAYER